MNTSSIDSATDPSPARIEWSKIASEYSQHAQAFTQQYIATAVDDAIAALPPREDKRVTCLDIAAGTGAATFYLAEALSRVHPDYQVSIVATDSNEAMLNILKAKIPEKYTSRTNIHIETKQMDMQNLDSIETDSMNLVTMTFGIMFPDDSRKALEEVHRVLAPGGVAILTSWFCNTIFDDTTEALVDQNKVQVPSEVSIPILDFGNSLYMLKLAKKAGIEKLSYRYIQKDNGYPLATAFLTRTMMSSPVVASYGTLDEDRVKAFLDEFADGSNEYGPYRLVHATALCLRIGF